MTRPVSPSLRAKIENAVERRLAVLDPLDGDPDLEDDAPLEDGGDREPSLCGLMVQVFGDDGDFEDDIADRLRRRPPFRRSAPPFLTPLPAAASFAASLTCP